jgi:hypothetical protein
MKYVSRQQREISDDDLQEIAAVSVRNNAKHDVTGLLVKIGDYFFQILEGPAEAVDATYARICNDERHTDIVVVGMPESASERLFGDWAMRVELLDPATEARLEPFSHMLTTVVELIHKSVEMSEVLQRSLLHELRQPGPFNRRPLDG